MVSHQVEKQRHRQSPGGETGGQPEARSVARWQNKGTGGQTKAQAVTIWTNRGTVSHHVDKQTDLVSEQPIVVSCMCGDMCTVAYKT